MSGFANSIIAGMSKLIRAAIRSPNYAAGSTGWSINKDGTAELNDVTIRGNVIVGEATPGPSIVIDTTAGTISVYNSSGILTGTWWASQQLIELSSNLTNPVGASSLILSAGTGAGGGNVVEVTMQVAGAGASGGLQAQPDGSSYQLTLSPPAPSGGLGGASLQLVSDQAVAGDAGQALLQSSKLVELLAPALQLGGPVAVGRKNGTRYNIAIQGALVYANPSTGAAETWQTPGGYGTGWAGGPTSGTNQPLQFRRTGTDDLYLTGSFHSTTATPGGFIAGIGASYAPAVIQRLPCVLNHSNVISGGFLQIDTSGNVNLTPAVTASATDVIVSGSVPLGIIP